VKVFFHLGVSQTDGRIEPAQALCWKAKSLYRTASFAPAASCSMNFRPQVTEEKDLGVKMMVKRSVL